MSSIDNVGPNKAIGFVHSIILTPDYIEKFKGDEYMITCASTSGNCNCTTDRNFCDVYIIHKPTVKQFINLNPNIFQTIPVECLCDSKNQRNIEDDIYPIVKYYMMNQIHKSPPVPVPSYLENATQESLSTIASEKEYFVGALFGNDSLLIRKNIQFPYRFEGNRTEGVLHRKNCSCKDCKKKGDIDETEEKHDFEDEEQVKLGHMGGIFPNNSDEINKYFLDEAGGNVSKAIDNIFYEYS